jgi:hypothetical protein
MAQLLNGHSDIRESVEEVMQIIENDGPRSRDPIWLDQWRPVRQRACS